MSNEIATPPSLSGESRSTPSGSLSLPGVLALISGCGLLFAYWKFHRLTSDWTSPGRRVFLLGAAALVVWGVFQLVSGFFARGRSGRMPMLNRHPVSASREGLVCLVMFSVMFTGSLLGRSNMLMLVSSMLVGPFILNGWITFSMLRRTRAGRHVPRRAMAGEPIPVEITLENRKRVLSSWLMSARDRIESLNECLEAGVLFLRVPPGGRRSEDYQLRLMQRGRYRFGPIYLSSRFPLGLGERGVLFNVTDEILVYPRIGRLTSQWRREQMATAELVHQRRSHHGVFDDEFHRIREFRWGDNPRAIHWRTAARKNELMVREFQQCRDQDLTVLLELWQPKRPDEDDLERVELAVSFAATVCVDFMNVGRDAKFGWYACGRDVESWHGRATPAGLEVVLDHLAVVRAGSNPDRERMLQQWRAERTSNTRTILVTTRPREMRLVDETNRDQPAQLLVESSGPIQVFEATRRELEPYFQLV